MWNILVSTTGDDPPLPPPSFLHPPSPSPFNESPCVDFKRPTCASGAGTHGDVLIPGLFPVCHTTHHTHHTHNTHTTTQNNTRRQTDRDRERKREREKRIRKTRDKRRRRERQDKRREDQEIKRRSRRNVLCMWLCGFDVSCCVLLFKITRLSKKSNFS